ncbi:hypothetical protein INP50_03440 [Chlamydia suis]|uniref:hypothetical protein n=2 Tax=Chlamydia suis TaxID=83559 RepID=UPI0013A55E68|nr:hypothetical protein [Chlamydia suis]QYC85138.1 hypothetical protein INQ96_03535 [Chlamydia suis]QYC89634.1 hypothetical protein INP50_03440 [Chlamydia suis]
MRQASSYGGGGGLLQTSSYEGGGPLGGGTDNLDLRGAEGVPPKELCDCVACAIARWASKEGPRLEDPRLLVERLFVLSELPDPGMRLLLFGGIGKGIVVVLWFFNLGSAKFKFFD